MKFNSQKEFLAFCAVFYAHREIVERAAYIAERKVSRKALDYSKTKPEENKFFYMDTIIKDKNRLIGEVAKGGKLASVPVLLESQNCARCIFLRKMIDAGFLPADTALVSCFQSEFCKGCWQNFTQNHCGLMRKDNDKSFADLENCDPDLKTIDALMKSYYGLKKVREFLDAAAPFIRAGKAGCSSHSFVTVEETSNAAAILSGFARHGMEKRIVFISAGYAPVTVEDYKKLIPFMDSFVLHFSLSPWFSDEENALRIAALKVALDAGLTNVFVRMVTNADGLDGWDNSRLSYVLQLLDYIGFDRDRILETPYHNDGAAGRPHSHASGLFKYRCCSTGNCLECPVHCMTNWKELQEKGVKYPEKEFHVTD